MEPSVAAVLPSSSEAGAESITRAVTGKKQQTLQRGFLLIYTSTNSLYKHASTTISTREVTTVFQTNIEETHLK